jgi:G3E family GTPase
MSSHTEEEEEDNDDDDDDEAPLLVSLLVDDPASADSDRTVHPSRSLEPKEPLPVCPVTILSGALGSGKTTLIQYILKSPHHHKRIAVIENEFGEGLSIESLIATDGVNNSSLEEFIELPNGCVCCTVKDSLVETLENLVEKRPDLDYILIEASGMANPGPIAAVFWLDSPLESRLRLDGVVTLVDVFHLSRQLRHTRKEAWQQIAFADRILVNKIDLIQDDESAMRQVQATVRLINPTAQLQTTTFSQVPNLDFILNANCYNQQHTNDTLNETIQQLVHQDDNHSHNHDHDATNNCVTCQHIKHTHTSNVSTVAFCEPGTMSLVKLHAWLASLLWPHQDEHDQVLRAKLEQQELELAQDPPQTCNVPTKDDDEEEEEEEEEQQIFRIKGVVSIQCSLDKMDDMSEWIKHCDASTGVDKRRYIVQAVYDIWDVYPSQDDFGSDSRECKLVVIGRHLPRDELLQGFRSCLL